MLYAFLRALFGLKPRPPSFGEWAAVWLSDRQTELASWLDDKQRLTVWLPRFSRARLGSIRQHDVEAILNALIAKGLSPGTRNRHRAMIHCLFQSAVDASVISENPVTRIEPLDVRWRESRPEVLSRAEMRRYLAASWRVSVEWGALATILVWSGLRIGEAVALHFEDVRPDTLIVRRTWDKRSSTVCLRTKSGRKGGHHETLCPPQVKRAIRRVTRATGRREGRIVSLTYWQAFTRHRWAAKRAGLMPFRLHAIRHLFAQLVYEAVGSEDFVGEVLGHRDGKSTKRYLSTRVSHVVRKAKRVKFGA